MAEPRRAPSLGTVLCWGKAKQVRAALRIPQGQRNAFLTTALGSAASLVEELALGTIDRNPTHHWHYAVVPSPRYSISWSLSSPYLCSRRTVPKMCFCSCFLTRF